MKFVFRQVFPDIEVKRLGRTRATFVVLLTSAILLILIKLWLVEAQTLAVKSYLSYDDRLFMVLANHIAKGDWLGPYNNTTLIKGPFYPIWIAAVYRIGMPLLLAEHLLYVGACIVIVFSVKPLFNSNMSLFLVFSILLFNPSSFSDGPMTRAVRDGIYPALTLLVLACSFALLIRQDNTWIKLFPWAVGLGISIGAFWITREEGVILLPSLILISGVAVVKILVTHPPDCKQKLLIWMVPVLIWSLFHILTALTNQLHYGLFAKSEFDSKVFNAAYGSILRVKKETWDIFSPITKHDRLNIYEVSPAFDELRPHIEGGLGRDWTSTPEGEEVVIPAHEFLWVFRDAIARAGYYSDGKFPEQYFRRLTNDIEIACVSGELECHSKRSTLMPIITPGHINPIISAFKKQIWFLLNFKGFNPFPGNSKGKLRKSSIFRELSREQISAFETPLLKISGTIFQEKELLSMQVFNMQEEPVNYFVKNKPSPELFNEFHANGVDIEEAKKAGFTLEAKCPDQCIVEIWSGDGLLLRSASKELLKHEVDPMDENRFYFQLDEVVHDYLNLEYQPDRGRTFKRKILALAKIGSVYQSLTLFFTFFAFVGYIYLSLRLLKRRDNLISWVVITSIFGALIGRGLLISLVEATSFRAINEVYLASSYALLLLFNCLVIFTIMDESAHKIWNHKIRNKEDE